MQHLQYLTFTVLLCVCALLVTADDCRPRLDFHFHYVTQLPADVVKYPGVPPWTFVANVSDAVKRVWVIQMHNNTLLHPPMVNTTIKSLVLWGEQRSVLINTTIDRNQGLYIVCLLEHNDCKTCVFIQALYFLSFTLQDFTVISQKRSQTWIEFEYSKVWNLPFPIYARTAVYLLDKTSRAKPSAERLRAEKTVTLASTYNFVNTSGLTPGQLYFVQANISLNLQIPPQYRLQNDQVRLPTWAYRRFYAATLPEYNQSVLVASGSAFAGVNNNGATLIGRRWSCLSMIGWTVFALCILRIE